MTMVGQRQVEPGVLAAPGWRALVVSVSKDPNAKLTVLLFPKGHASPGRCVKVPTTPAAASALQREADILVGIHRRGLGTVACTVPRVLGDVPTPAGTALVTTGMPGTPLITRYHRWHHTASKGSVAAEFEAAGTWLDAFWRATVCGEAVLDTVTPLLPAMSMRFHDHPHLDHILNRLRAIRVRLAEVRSPVTATHGDFWFGNLLVDEKGVSGVLDWEAGALTGQPVGDLVRFALSYALYLDRHTRCGRGVAGHFGLRAGPFGAGIAHLFWGQGWFPEISQDFLARGLTNLGLPTDLWRDLLLVGLAEVAVTADHSTFAASHLELLESLAEMS